MQEYSLDLPGGGKCPYSVRVSRRCRSMSLRMTSARGLELVLPPRASLKAAHEFAKANIRWVERAFAKFSDAAKQRAKAISEEGPLPASLELKALGESLPIDYRDSRKMDFISARIETPGRLLVEGDLSQAAACRAAIKEWLKLRAKRLFAKRVAEICAETGLKCAGVSVRDQKGRWGSCSARGSVCLNFRLLLMEPEFLRHVILHELCHTVEMNHSERFWAHVERYEPGARRIRAALREESKRLPAWLASEMEL